MNVVQVTRKLSFFSTSNAKKTVLRHGRRPDRSLQTRQNTNLGTNELLKERGNVMELLVDLAPRHQVKLRFFDVDAVIRSDSRACIQLFTQMYQRLRVEAIRAPIEFPPNYY